MIERRYCGASKPLKKVLPDLFPEISYGEISACLRRRDVKIDDRRASADSLIYEGAIVRIYPKKTKDIKVLYEDDNLLACYKPKGIASEGDVSFTSLVTSEKGAVRLMHRLDTNTDGVLLFAKNDIAYREIYDAMKAGLIAKEYRAEVYGVPDITGECQLTYYYKKDAEGARAIISDAPKEGFSSVSLSFSVEARREDRSILRVIIHKGKMHQIRAMLAYYGHFILGDGKYGSDKINRLLGVRKTLLTATAVTFDLPESSPLAYLNRIRIEI